MATLQIFLVLAILDPRLPTFFLRVQPSCWSPWLQLPWQQARPLPSKSWLVYRQVLWKMVQRVSLMKISTESCYCLRDSNRENRIFNSLVSGDVVMKIWKTYIETAVNIQLKEEAFSVAKRKPETTSIPGFPLLLPWTSWGPGWAWKNFQACLEFVALTPAVQGERSNNWANKPNWEQVNNIELVCYKPWKGKWRHKFK